MSQWRGYGVGGGIALVFDTHKLEEILPIEEERYSYSSVYLTDVIYSDDELKFEMELSPKLNDLTDYIAQSLDHIAHGKQELPDAKNAYSSFIHGTSSYKHHGFKEENEVRIVTLASIHNDGYLRLAEEKGFTLKSEKERKFRKKNGKLIPYIELFNSTDIVLPIEGIIVGPHKEKELRASVLRVMMRNTNTKITISDIPYVA